MVRVLCYHRIGGGNDDYSIPRQVFLRQVRILLVHHYASINSDDYLAWRRGEKRLPHQCFLLTFDDGYASDYEVVYPILKKLSLRATFFPVIGNLGRPQHLTVEQIREMSEDRNFAFGSHTMTHPKLTQLGPEALDEELTDSKRRLEKMVGRRVNALAYPFGLWNRIVSQVARQSGYALAFTTVAGINYRDTDPMALRRIVADKKDSLETFTLAVTNNTDFYRTYYRRWLRESTRMGLPDVAKICRKELVRIHVN